MAVLSCVYRICMEDIVCRGTVEENSRFFSDYGGKIYYFCSPECKRRFDDHPDSFIQEKAREDLHLND